MSERTKHIFFFFAGTLIVLFLAGCSSMRSIGKVPSKKQRREFAQYPNFEGKEFHNLYPITDTLLCVDSTRAPLEKKIRKYSKRPKLSQPMPSVKTDLKAAVYDKPTITWLGHSTYLVQSKEITILVDPFLSDFASPLWYINRSIPGSHVFKVKDLPKIDLILITHEHYDHFDYKTMRKLRKKHIPTIVPIGVGTLLKHWGWKSADYQEVYWGDTISIRPDIKITSTPSQHWSGRWVRMKRRMLWTSYVLDIDGYRLFLSGDGGYNKHFKDIGDAYGPFDLAILENGHYNPEWPLNHSFPEQTRHTAQDVQARMVLPVHWGKLAPAYHAWNDPIKELLEHLDELEIPATVPMIGQPYTIGEDPLREVWWDFE